MPFIKNLSRYNMSLWFKYFLSYNTEQSALHIVYSA